MERIYATALQELRSRERCTEEYLRHTAIRTLLHKTTMFSPKVLLDAGTGFSMKQSQASGMAARAQSAAPTATLLYFAEAQEYKI